MNQIYLDNAATTKPSKDVVLAMSEIQQSAWGNPSSIHSTGQKAAQVLTESRQEVAKFLGCQAQEIVFTSGGSESDNLAVRGLVDALTTTGTNSLQKSFKIDRSSSPKPHIITSAMEHHAVLHTVQDLEKEGRIEATYIKPDHDGIISPSMVAKEIRKNTVLVSLIYVNNETGVVTPIAEIGAMLDDLNNGREYYDSIPKDHTLHIKNHHRVYFHTDAVQAAEWEEMNVDKLKVDLLTFTAHKIHGPKGIGVLFKRKGTPLKAQITGGGQEFNLRAGTENVAAIVGLSEAVKSIDINSRTKVARLRDKLINNLLETIPNSRLNGSRKQRAPHIANISFINAEGEAIILNLDFRGIAVSSGSACTSRSLEPSHVLSAMGIPPEQAHGSIRFSLSRDTSEEEIDKVLEILPEIIEKLRAMSPFK